MQYVYYIGRAYCIFWNVFYYIIYYPLNIMLYRILPIIHLTMYKGESKSKGKIHLTALIAVTVSNFTNHFSTHSPCNTMHLLYRSTSFCIPV